MHTITIDACRLVTFTLLAAGAAALGTAILLESAGQEVAWFGQILLVMGLVFECESVVQRTRDRDDTAYVLGRMSAKTVPFPRQNGHTHPSQRP